MSDPIIKVENLSKAYLLGRKESKEDTLVSSIASTLSAPIRNLKNLSRLNTFRIKDDQDDIFWALKGISFSVNEGEVLGIIGKNGAGKSTLLKVLSRITEPTSGRIEISGRVSSLLEVGTGFHPELTGRENVYMNGTILGMRKREIDRKFEQIVAFAGVQQFIDTPIKRYSSGMKVRLAFAVAAHLEPEILIIDEVLAVGDLEFQKQCLGKMQDVASEGRTVLFVSHNMATVQSLCTRCLLVDGGSIVEDGSVSEVVDAYSGLMKSLARATSIEHRDDREGGAHFRFVDIEFIKDGCCVEKVQTGSAVRIRLRYKLLKSDSIERVAVSIGFMNQQFIMLTRMNSGITQHYYNCHETEGVMECVIDKLPLTPGRYFFNLHAQSTGQVLDWVKNAGYIDVESGDFYGSGKLPNTQNQSVLVDYHWE